MIYPLDSAIKCLNNQGQMFIGRRAWSTGGESFKMAVYSTQSEGMGDEGRMILFKRINLDFWETAHLRLP